MTQDIETYPLPEVVPDGGRIDQHKSQYLIHVHGFHVDWPEGAHKEFGEMFRRLYWMGYPWPELVQNEGVVDLNKTQYLIHVHGFHVGWPDGAHKEFGELFRRIYWMGYRGNFVGFNWEGDESFEFLKFKDQQENAFQNAPCFRWFLETKVYREWGAKVSNVRLFAHSLGNQIVFDALRLYQIENKGTKLAQCATFMESAVNGETFWQEANYTYAGAYPITYSVEDLKHVSWAFFFNQNNHRALDSVNNAIHSYNPGDYALIFMMIGDRLFAKMNSFNKTVRSTEVVPTSNRAPYNRLDENGASLAYDIPMMLRFDKRDPSYAPPSFVAPLGRDSNSCIKQGRNLNANKMGWRRSSHSGLKGSAEWILGINGQIWSGATSLPQIWRWFEKIRREKGFEIGKE